MFTTRYHKLYQQAKKILTQCWAVGYNPIDGNTQDELEKAVKTYERVNEELVLSFKVKMNVTCRSDRDIDVDEARGAVRQCIQELIGKGYENGYEHRLSEEINIEPGTVTHID